ncbi:MAG TPA: LptA/OstA family protein [Acetobacteraceae bacterium]|nr:LptA/OstA family protein [Acetobacteraceae bacterium]
MTIASNGLVPGPGRAAGAALLAVCAAVLVARPAAAQQIDMSHGGPIAITASDGIEWHQMQQEVIALGNAKAVRDNVTVTADRLIAWYRKKGTDAGTAPPAPTAPTGLTGDADTGGNEVYRVRAEGHVHIFTQTDEVVGDVATYDLDQAVLVVTGHNLKLTTPTQVLTARDDLEYWSQRHMAVARGDAVAVTNDGRRLQADTLVAYTTAGTSPPSQGAAAQGSPSQGSPSRGTVSQGTPAVTPVAAKTGAPPGAPAPGATPDALASSGKLEKVEAYGHVVVRTVTDTVTGDRAVYVPDTGIARVAGVVRITRGDNQLDGSEAEVNLKTGISRLLAGNTGRVQGLVVPTNQANQPGAATPAPGSPAPASAASAPGSGGNHR